MQFFKLVELKRSICLLRIKSKLNNWQELAGFHLQTKSISVESLSLKWICSSCFFFFINESIRSNLLPIVLPIDFRIQFPFISLYGQLKGLAVFNGIIIITNKANLLGNQSELRWYLCILIYSRSYSPLSKTGLCCILVGCIDGISNET